MSPKLLQVGDMAGAAASFSQKKTQKSGTDFQNFGNIPDGITSYSLKKLKNFRKKVNVFKFFAYVLYARGEFYAGGDCSSLYRRKV